MNPAPTLASLLVLCVGIVLAAAPHIPRLPLWVSALATAAVAWRAWAAWRGERMPRRWLLYGLVVFGVVGVFVTHRTIFGRDAGVTMLVLFLALKLLETRTQRDAVIVTFLCYFLALTSFFYTQTIAIAGLMLVTVLVLTAALIGFNAPGRPLQGQFRTAGVLLAQGLPVMLLLFLFFPRVAGPLWGMPTDAYSGMTGLSDSMTPGAISSLSRSDSIAFRVRFDEAPPQKNALYWRGPVFWRFDGHAWDPGIRALARQADFVPMGAPLTYTVTVEPHNRRWLFALDLPGRVPPNADVTEDFQLNSRIPVRTRVRYSMSSFLAYRALSAGSEQDLKAALQLPAGFNPKATALARQWARESADRAEILERAIDFFRSAGLGYTLAPPPLGRDSVDEFLFGTRRGFCEHFASAFAFMMRAAGVPTRVVTGYQGGETNPVDGYVVVRQADAHAWTEVWLGERGWVRVDPTAAAIPLRIESGLAAAVPAGESLPFLVRADLNWLRALRFNWEALANYWNQWVLGYSPDRQRGLFNRLGMPEANWQAMAQVLFWTVGAVIAAFSFWLLRRAAPGDAAQVAWMKFCAKLARRGTQRGQDEGPRAFGSRAVRAHPGVARRIDEITSLYIDLRYGPAPEHGGVSRLRALVREFRI
jgi:transglutaminase-like putative cysteine protease